MTISSTDTPAANFLRNIIEQDLASDRFRDKRWSGTPGPAEVQQSAPLDPARIRTRFPPEPNGYLHIGHAKSICLNFGLARDFGGTCHLRYDDTNPEKEEQEYVNAIADSVRWLGFDWHEGGKENRFFASDYFAYMYDFALTLIEHGHAYVEEQTPDQIRENRGTLKTPGINSPWRERPVEESLALFKKMRAGDFPDGKFTLRAKIDMASPNINLRDPVIYRIRHAVHHRTGNDWPIYPLYAFAHPVEDALEGITHSICTLEFEDQRPFYNWVLERLREHGRLRDPLPQQYEFSRLNLDYVVTSKRKLLQLVKEHHVNGWDDPRLPTIMGLRRRGYTPESIRLFCERLGVSKSESHIDYSLLEQALRDDLDPKVDRSVAILDPIKLVITNYPEDETEQCHAPRHPHDPDRGKREFPFSRTLLIERDDFKIDPPKKYFRLFPGNMVRLKYAYVIRCTDYKLDEHGQVAEVHAEYLPDTKSATPGADSVKVKGNITWVSAEHALEAQINLYDRLFTVPSPDAGERNYLDYLNKNSLQQVKGWLEPGLRIEPGKHWQFERLGYFVADQDATPEQPVLNRCTTLRDSWTHKGAK